MDDIAVFENRYGVLNRGEAMAIIEEICRSGGGSGVNIVIGISRRMDLPATMAVGFRHRIVLKLTSEDEASMLGVPASITGDLPEGRAIHEGHWAQIAIGRGCGGCDRISSATTPRLPDRVDLDGIVVENPAPGSGPATGWTIPIGVGTDDLEPRFLDLGHGHGIVTGPRRSGRSTTLDTIAYAWRAGVQTGHDTLSVLIGPVPQRAGDDPSTVWDSQIRTVGGPWEVPDGPPLESVLSDLLATAAGGTLVLIGIEELPTMLEGPDADALERFLGNASGASTSDSLRIVAAGEIDAMARCYSPAVSAIRSGRTGILLRPDVDVHGSILGCDLGRRDELESRPGRGWLVTGGDPSPVQIACAPDTD